MPCGSIFARTHIETDKDCSITVDIPDTWNDLDTVDFTVDLYRVAEVDKNGTYAVTDDYKELSGMVESIDSKTTADDYEKMAKSASEIVDKEGNLCPHADNQVFFSVEGGRIVGVDNGNPISMERFKDNKRKAFNGRCLVVVATDGGKVTLKARGYQIAPAQVEVISFDEY